MKFRSMLIAGVVAPGIAFSSQGPTGTLGHSLNPVTSLYSNLNPASNSMLIPADETFRWGYLSNIGMSMEFGDVDNFVDEVDELIDALDEEDLTIDDANEIISQFENLLPIMGDEGYMTGSFNAELPIMPFLFRSTKMGGTFSLNAQMTGSGSGQILDAPLVYNQTEEELETATSLYIKGAVSKSFSLGYSRNVYDFSDREQSPFKGLVFGGLRANLYTLELSKQVVSLMSTDGDDETGDIISDAYDENNKKTTNVGIDLGVTYIDTNYQLGATLYNINEPEFDYGRIGENCSQHPADSADRNNCVAARYFSGQGEISLKETYTMSARLTLDGAVQTSDKHWQLGGSIDTNSIYDSVGHERQLGHISASYFADSSWIPSVRLGYSKNLAGSKLSMLHGGLTFFGGAHIDLAYGLETVDVDGEAIPRSFGFSFGFEHAF